MESVEQQSRFGVAGGQHVMGTGDGSWQTRSPTFAGRAQGYAMLLGRGLLGGTGAQETWLKGCRPSTELQRWLYCGAAVTGGWEDENGRTRRRVAVNE